MRLGQLARKLSLRPVEIVEYLNTKNIKLEEGSNTRIDDELVRVILLKFAPSRTLEDLTSAQEENTKVENLISEPVNIETAPIIEETPVVAEIQDQQVEDVKPVSVVEEDKEVIKAPKLELAGLKVLGKIELPEPKKKEQVIDLEIPAEGEKPKANKPPVRKPYNQERRSSASQRSGKNPIAEAREREIEEAKRKREEEAELAREQRRKNYNKKIKVSAPTKRIKLIDEQTEEVADVTEQPKTWFGKIAKWFKT